MGSEHDPLVSVIVPLYNGERFIGETLDHILQQTHASLEVLVVDDGSTDEGPRVVRNFGERDARVKLVTKPHMGIAGTRNAGLSRVEDESRYVLFLDQDDILDPSVVRRLVRILATRPDAVGAYVVADYIDEQGNPFLPGQFAGHMLDRRGFRDGRWAHLAPTEDVLWHDLFIVNHLYPPSAVLLRREVVCAIGGFDRSYVVADDWDLMIRAARRGPIAPHNDILVGYRRHGVNASSNTDRNVRETRALWANVYYSDENTPADMRLLRRIWRAHQRVTAKKKGAAALKALSRLRLYAGLKMLMDAGGHALIPWPLRSWGTSAEGEQRMVTRGVRARE